MSGCTRNCPGCCNPEAQDFEFGEKLDGVALFHKIIEHEDIIDNIRIMGGDLLCQRYEESRFLSEALRITFPTKQLILYTGASFNEIPQWCYEVFDAIKYGRYIQELHCDNPLYGSSNQRYIRKGEDYD